MWTFQSTSLNDEDGVRVDVELSSQPASFKQVVEAWRSDRSFCLQFSSWLGALPYKAFRWETRPVALDVVSRPFEFAAFNSLELVRTPDPQAFARYFGDAKDGVVAFPNIRGDATLVVPTPINGLGSFAHLASFIRTASNDQQHALWRCVGESMARRINNKTVWLSTAGAGVPWLHVRLDDRPKYYKFQPYRTSDR